jgi:hypothetical protein
MVDPTNDEGNTEEPAYTRASLISLISGTVMFVVLFIDGRHDFITEEELDRLQNLLLIAAPILAAYLIRKKVTPTAKVERIIEAQVATGVAQQVGQAVSEAVSAKEADITTFLAAAANPVAEEEPEEPAPPAKKAAPRKAAPRRRR